MAVVQPHDRVMESSTSNSQTVFAVAGAIDTSYYRFSQYMSIGDTTMGGVVEEGVAFKSGILTYSAANQITVSTTKESKGTFSAGGAKKVFMGLPASRAFGPVFAYEGDSLTDVTGLGIWPTYLAQNFAFFNRGATYNYALSGDTAALMVGEYASQAGSLVLGQEAYFFIWAGTNDLGASVAATTIYGYLTSLWSSARTSGYKVVAFTIMPRLDGNTIDDQRIALNALIRSDGSLYDYLIEPDLYFTDTAERTIFGTTAHLTTAGNAYLARRVAANILGVEPIPATPRDALASGLEINGTMEIDQRNAGTSVTGITASNAVVVDGYRVLNAGPSVVTVQQVSDAPPGLTNSLKISVTTAEASLAAGSFVWIRTAVEGYRTAKLAFGTRNAAPLTLGFFTKAHRIGTYSATLINSAGNRGYTFAFTQNVADAWEFKTAVIPGDVTGTWIGNTNGVGLYLFVVMAAGSTFAAATPNTWGTGIIAATTQTNGIAATSDIFQLTGVKILHGSHALISEGMRRILRPTDDEIRLCQRQFCSDFPLGTAPADNVRDSRYTAISYIANSLLTQRINFPVRMRVAPTVTPYSSNNAPHGAGKWQYFNAAGSFADATSVTTSTADMDGFCFILGSTVTNSGGWAVSGSWKADAAIY